MASSTLRFNKPQYFTPDTSRRGWTCNVCVPQRTNQFYFPNIKVALRHEHTSAEHARHTSEAEWWKPQDDRSWGSTNPPLLTFEGLRTWEMQTHVDHVHDLVPFWMRGVDAAERGEVLKLEEFLQKMEADGGWRTVDEVWGILGAWRSPNYREGSDGWGRKDRVASLCKARGTDSTSDDEGRGWGVNDGWAALSNHTLSNRGAERVGRTQDSPQESSYSHPFVEDIALQEAADDDKRRKMHQFFEMPTEQKVLKIQETIRYLRAHPA